MDNPHISFELLQTAHFPLLLKWLEIPHVKMWWDQDIKWTPKRIKEKYESYVQGYKMEQGIKKPLHAYIVYQKANPIGYIQFYNAHKFSTLPLTELPHSLAALDFYIGEEDYLRKGLGTTILKQFLKDYVDPSYEACFVDPMATNLKAI